MSRLGIGIAAGILGLAVGAGATFLVAPELIEPETVVETETVTEVETETIVHNPIVCQDAIMWASHDINQLNDAIDGLFLMYEYDLAGDHPRANREFEEVESLLMDHNWDRFWDAADACDAIVR